MTNPRLASRFVHIWALFTAVVGFLLLFVLGGFVTSYRVGMADPVWPTEPWYLVDKNWEKLEFGFLVEHTHRAAGWIFGLLSVVLSFAAWWGEPNRKLRTAGFISALALVVAYGAFHGAMMAAGKLHKDGTSLRDIDWTQAKLTGAVTLAAALAVLACGALAIRGGLRGRWIRALGMSLLVVVMVQGLLGGFRVLLNSLAGTELAAYHGVFAQFVFCHVVAIAVLNGVINPAKILPDSARQKLSTPSALLVILGFLQLGWGAMLRHTGTDLAQRLHILTAFAVTILMVVVSMMILLNPQAKAVKGKAIHLLALLACQLVLGVEAYLLKFAAIGPQASTLPEARTIDAYSAGLRTLHLLVGLGLLASSLALTLRIHRRAIGNNVTIPTKTETVSEIEETAGV